MKRVLVIAYYWPPSGGSGVQRWVKFCKYLPQEGWEPVVYVPENPDYITLDPSLEAELPPQMEVLRRPILEPYALYRKLMGKGASTVVTEITSGKKSWKQRLSLWIRANLFVPDPRVSWVRPSVRFLKKYLAAHPVDVIVTTGPPQSMHLIGQRLHRATGIPWIMDFRDPWTQWFGLGKLPLSAAAWKKQRRLEKSAIDEASALLTVTPFVQRDFQAMTSTPVAMIPNGFDQEDYTGPVQPDGYFNVVQTGFLSADGNPALFWKILGEKAAGSADFRAALRIRLCGLIDPEVQENLRREGLEPNLVLLGYCPHKQAVQEQRGASLLLLPLRDAPEMRAILPGKVFEYLAARRPVLGFGQTDGAQAALLEETGAGVTAGWADETLMRDFLEKQWQQHLSGGVPATTCAIDRYSRASLTHELALLLNIIVLSEDSSLRSE